MTFGKFFDIFGSIFKNPEKPKIPDTIDVPEPPSNTDSGVDEGDETTLIKVPTRSSTAVSGSQFIQANLNLSGSARESHIIQELAAGNIPDFLKNLTAITVSNSAGRVTYYVMTDYISIGSEQDYVRIPMTPISAQIIADAYGCILPTRKMVNDIWKNSVVKLPPKPIPPDSQMGSTKRYADHNAMVQKQLVSTSFDALLSGHKKDVVLTNKLFPNNPNKRVAIYGWIQLNGVAIQGLNPTSHESTYADYSHGIRYVSRKVLVNDEVKDILDVLKDSQLSSLLSDEGILNFVRY